MISVVTRKFLTVSRILFRRIVRLATSIYIFMLEMRIPRDANPPKGSLLKYCNNTYSQVGQDGIIEEIFNRLQIQRGSFCEFGAWDGFHLSNARKLAEENWTGIFIEGDSDRFLQLLQNYPSPEIVKINAWVGYRGATGEGGNVLAELLLQHVSKQYIDELDLLIIDVDGVDLEIALSSGVRPKVIVLEGGSSFSPIINAPFPEAANNFQHPLEYIVSRMESIGYISVCFRQDLFLVRQELVSSILSPDEMRSAKELFAENFHCLPRATRRWQMTKRLESPSLRDFEAKFLGSFHPNPLSRS